MVQFASYLRRVLFKTRLIFPRINGPNVDGDYNGDDDCTDNNRRVLCHIDGGANNVVFVVVSDDDDDKECS